MSENITSTPIDGGDVTSTTEVASPEITPTLKNLSWDSLNDDDRQKVLSTYKEKMIINGKEKEMTLAEIKKRASIQEAANEKFEFGKKAQSELDTFKKDLESGRLVDALERQGKNREQIKEILMDRLADLLEEEKMDPKDKELRYLKEKLAKQEAEEKALKEQEENAKIQREQQAYRAKLEGDLPVMIAISDDITIPLEEIQYDPTKVVFR